MFNLRKMIMDKLEKYRKREEVKIMPTGVYERKRRTERENNGMNNKSEKENFLHFAIENLEKRKEEGVLDIDMINKWIGQLKSLGEDIARDFDKAIEEKNKPKRISLILRVTSTRKEVREELVENAYQLIEQSKTIHPEAKFTISQLNE